jgi:serine/threonine protein kinase
MAPEVLKCPLKTYPDENKADVSLHYSSSVDTWAVGVLAYELLTGGWPLPWRARPSEPLWLAAAALQ